MKAQIELVCGQKLKGVSGRKVHKLRAVHKRKQPCQVITFDPKNPDQQEIAKKMLAS